MKNKKTKLLFITQRIHQNDDDLAFTILWVKEFIKQGIDVRVICLEKYDFDDSFPVYSLGKEKGVGKISRIIKFLKLIFTLKYNRVFVHMNPEYITLGGWFWILKRAPIYLWSTHYSDNIHIRVSGLLCKRMFAATHQSLPQFNGNPKKVIPGHGIDINFWMKDYVSKEKNEEAKFNLISVHRLSRSKRLEIAIKALNYLPEKYNLAVYGRDLDKQYYVELVDLIKNEKLENRVKLNGPVPMEKLKEVYPGHRLMINMAHETIDKTMLEVMLFGIYPITTPANSKAIGLPIWPDGEDPQKIAKFILGEKWKEYEVDYLRNIVENKHSLSSLINSMNEYIINGR